MRLSVVASSGSASCEGSEAGRHREQGGCQPTRCARAAFPVRREARQRCCVLHTLCSGLCTDRTASRQDHGAGGERFADGRLLHLAELLLTGNLENLGNAITGCGPGRLSLSTKEDRGAASDRQAICRSRADKRDRPVQQFSSRDGSSFVYVLQAWRAILPDMDICCNHAGRPSGYRQCHLP